MLSEIYTKDASSKAYKLDMPWALFLSLRRHNQSSIQKLRITSIAITTAKGPMKTVHFVKAHLSSGSRKKEHRYICLSEVQASHSQRT
jgi:hypothetical protein